MNSSVFALGEASLEKIDSKANTLISQNLGDPTKIEEIGKHLEAAFKESRKKREFVYEEHVDNNRLSCTHCPTYIQLTSSINAALQKMKETLGSDSEAVATDINRLNFLFYTVKSRQDDGSVKCERFRDVTRDLKPTQFPGRFDLMAEDSFQFPFGSELQLLDPKREEIIYYYRGVGPQRNIVVKAILTKEGGKFQYFYYRPTEDEKNPYRLPSIGTEPEDDDVTLARKKISKQSQEDPKPADDGKDRFSLVVDPRVETRLKVIPKNVHLAKGEVIQSVMGTGLKVTGESALSLKGNQASLNLKDEKGYSFVKVDIKTSLKGESTHSIEVPYEVQVTSPDVSQPSAGVKASGSFTDSTTATGVKLQITDGVTQYLRAETMRNKSTGVSSYTIARDLPISESSIVTVGVGRNEERKTYGTFQHRKSIKENVTMVLDVRLDQDRKASITYQLKAIF